MRNIAKTEVTEITQSIPKSARERREEKALAIVRAIQPKEVPPPVAVPYIPPLPDETYTFVGSSRDAVHRSTVVYFMYSGGRIKIGYSEGLRGRHMGLKKSGPFPPVLLLVMSGSVKDERELHRRFADDRLHGEWFAIGDKLRRYIRSRLCEVGHTSFDKAEAEMHEFCAALASSYRPPPKRRIHKKCAHEIPFNLSCAACERDRDLQTLAEMQEARSLIQGERL